MHWLSHWLGLDNPAGPIYAFWSGFGSDMQEFALLGVVFGGLAGLYHHHRCEIERCRRLGRHRTAAGHRLCRKHHPDGPLTVERAHAAHHAALRSCSHTPPSAD